MKAQFKTRQRRGSELLPEELGSNPGGDAPPEVAGDSQGRNAPGEGFACSDPDTPGERVRTSSRKRLRFPKTRLHPYPKERREQGNSFPPGKEKMMAHLGRPFPAHALKAQLQD